MDTIIPCKKALSVEVTASKDNAWYKNLTTNSEKDTQLCFDMHVHSKYSSDSTIPICDIVHCWKCTGILPLVCDHNSIEGSTRVYHEIRRVVSDIPEILAEEILTSDGEIIGAFLQEEIPAYLSAEETLDRIRDQGAVSIVPHPFCSFRTSVIRPDVLDRVAGRVDIIEGFNGRAIDERDNTYARRYAGIYRKPFSAGSDAHTAGELGRTYTEMEPFDSPKGLLHSIRSAEIHYQISAPVLRLSKKSIPRSGRHFGLFPETAKKCLREEL